MDETNQQKHEINMENAIIEIIENNLNQMSVDDSNLSVERRHTKSSTAWHWEKIDDRRA
jgi:hypothetical protein